MHDAGSAAEYPTTLGMLRGFVSSGVEHSEYDCDRLGDGCMLSDAEHDCFHESVAGGTSAVHVCSSIGAGGATEAKETLAMLVALKAIATTPVLMSPHGASVHAIVTSSSKRCPNAA